MMKNVNLTNNIFIQKRKKSRKINKSKIDQTKKKKLKFWKILKKKKWTNDSDYYFLISLLSYFKDLNALEKLEVRLNIQSVKLCISTKTYLLSWSE